MTDLQAAAERLRRHFGGEGVGSVWGRPDSISLDQRLDDQDAVIAAYLSEHLPDDDVAIDPAWFMSLRPLQKGSLTLYLSWQKGCLRVMASDEGGEVVLLKDGTRGQLRLLARALGVELGEGT